MSNNVIRKRIELTFNTQEEALSFLKEALEEEPKAITEIQITADYFYEHKWKLIVEREYSTRVVVYEKKLLSYTEGD